MEIKFVDVAPDHRIQSKTIILEMLAELKNHPNRWAELPLKINNASTVSYWRKKYPEFSFRASGGNTLTNTDPNKKLFTLYIRYNKTEESEVF